MKKILGIAKYAVFLALALFLVWWSLKDVEVRYMIHLMKKAHLHIVILTVLILIFSHWIRALRWNLLLEPLEFKPRILNSFMCILIGYFANLLMPRLGEILRCTLLAKYEKLPVDKIMGTVLLERIIDVFCLLLVCTLVFLLQIDLLSDFFVQSILPKLRAMDTQMYFVFLMLFVSLLLLLVYIGSKNANVRGLFTKIVLFVKGIVQGMKTVFKLQHKLRFLGYTLLIWLSYWMGIWVGFKALDETALLDITTGLTCLFTGSIGMITTQGGIGAYPLLISQTLQWYGVDMIYGITMGWLNWFVQLMVAILTGIVAWFWLPLYNLHKQPKI